jgi:hypothetical protein
VCYYIGVLLEVCYYRGVLLEVCDYRGVLLEVCYYRGVLLEACYYRGVLLQRHSITEEPMFQDVIEEVCPEDGCQCMLTDSCTSRRRRQNDLLAASNDTVKTFV